MIGHGASRQERQGLINYFRQAVPGVPLVVLLRSRDDDFNATDYNCPVALPNRLNCRELCLRCPRRT